jgi:pantoate--beta-alanine ligase
VLVLDVPRAMRAWSGQRRQAGRLVGLVPTMGALHEGHLSLIELARRRADDIVVSIFVNPLQFERRDDFDRYPRPIDEDVAACTAAGAAAVYAPTARTMYPEGFQTHIEPGPLADVMEGAMRPGHFRGVMTVVAKLFGAVGPHVAVFGEKDFQQLAVIRQMVDDLDMGVEIVAAPIVREADGLALSSRNRRLPAEDRRAAACIPRALDAAAALVAGGERDGPTIEAAAEGVIAAEPRARLEYVTVFDPDTLEPLDPLTGPARIAAAVWFADIRLIDNCELAPTA